ncbi:outer membrane lipoprotein chaperone LolA [Pseudenhygromyxa sp. WMMC2535]|uniref:outer membrane lipoprotein chaperone LolA n=1 Tax=Pseudenhygromyxa sp. WMMC2535 TaxID=2712867 RepID=UPI00155699C8|nr:outer membrane lipoprotein chaperone LolA [Pseudenhygromyxa sp. WMMC2535]NVB36480.1 outer membrane lipoprotein chaperone LolA [Pseudenhygromyxa sp. WMMC2535]
MNATIAFFLSLTLLGPGFGGFVPDAVGELLRAQEPASTKKKPEKATAPAWRPDSPSEVLVLVQAYYDGAGDLEAKFKQTYWNPTYAEAKKTAGKLQLKKPGKMVWNYADEQEADYYANGKTLWMVEHDTRQVIKTKVDENAEINAALKFLFGGQKLLEEFKVRYAKGDRVERYGDADHYVLELKPKKSNKHYKGLVLAVHATTGRVDSFVVYNTDGSSNYFELRNIKTNVGLKDGLFEFKLPSGYVENEE